MLDDGGSFSDGPLGVPGVFPGEGVGSDTFAGRLLLHRQEVFVEFSHIDAVAVDESHMIEIGFAVVIEEDEGVDLFHVGRNMGNLFLAERSLGRVTLGNGDLLVGGIGHVVAAVVLEDLRSPEAFRSP